MGVIKCPNCGLVVSDYSGECFGCGSRLPRQAKKPDEAFDTMFERAESSRTPHNTHSDIREDSWEKPNINESTASKTAGTSDNKTYLNKADDKADTKGNNKHTSFTYIRILLLILLVAAIILTMVLGWYFGIKIPRDNAYSAYLETVNTTNLTISQYNDGVLAFNDRAKEVISINNDFDQIIQEAQNLIDSGETPYEGEKITVLSNTLKDARNSRIETPELKETIESVAIDDTLEKSKKTDIELASADLRSITDQYRSETEKVAEQTESLIIPDYSSYKDNISSQSRDLMDSIAIQKQITAPTEEWVYTRLGQVNEIANISAVTEEHDPNGHLNKSGGYTATLYFSTPLLDTQDLSAYDIIEKGNHSGGAVEVYATVEDAEKRSDYLESFNGVGLVNSGSQFVLGTMVIRTADELKASQQETLTNAIVNAMISLE